MWFNYWGPSVSERCGLSKGNQDVNPGGNGVGIYTQQTNLAPIALVLVVCGRATMVSRAVYTETVPPVHVDVYFNKGKKASNVSPGETWPPPPLARNLKTTTRF